MGGEKGGVNNSTLRMIMIGHDNDKFNAVLF